jgi:hypothetical protein
MATGERSHPPAPTDRQKTVRDWIDVIAKAAIALVGVFLAYLASNYQQRTSVVTLLSQRETAESSLRSSMMEHLIGPFVGSAEQNKPLDPNRARVLLELLALNFHTHFELKPLFLKVDADLRLKKEEAGRTALEAVARRVVDRQIAMLRAATPDGSRGLLTGLFSKPPATAKQADLFFLRTQTLREPGRALRESDETDSLRVGNPAEEGINNSGNPALFGSGSGQSVCSVSPDRKYALRIRVTSYDPVQRTAGVSWQMGHDADACEHAVAERAGAGAGSGSDDWRRGKAFTLSPYDFPLTDNTQLDPTRRFALNLYYVADSDPQSAMIQLKLVWFPEGYITERERPMNYYQVNRTLGIE